jgi:hypothetical protein
MAKVGRPLAYTPEGLWEKYQEYKAAQQGHTKQVYDAKRKQVMSIEYDKPLTITGFANYAGIHRDTINSYKNERPEFSDIVKRIYQDIELDMVEKALTFEQHASFTAFLLNAVHGYRTAQEIVGQGGGPVQVQAQPAKVEDVLKSMDDEQRAALFTALGGILEGKTGETEDKMQDKEDNPAENANSSPAG